MNKVDLVERSRLRTDIPPFRPGDQVKVHVKVREGTRERVQIFEGVVIARRNGGLRETFTVRKISFGVGVERTFPIHGPSIAKLEVVRYGKVRRAKLYYLRELSGRHAKIAERRTRIPGAVVQAPPPGEPEVVEDVTVPETAPAASVETPGESAPPQPEAQAAEEAGESAGEQTE